MNKAHCPGCFEWMDPALGDCPACGHAVSESNDTQALSKGTVLRDRYVIGALLERNEFFSYYAGFDRQKGVRVILTEFFPIELVFRQDGGGASLYNANTAGDYQGGVRDFLLERSFLAQMDSPEGIVPIYECFTCDSIAYSVSEWYEASTFPKMVHSLKSPMPLKKSVAILRAICGTLDSLHRQNCYYGGICLEDLVKSAAGTWRLQPRPHGAEFALQRRMRSLRPDAALLKDRNASAVMEKSDIGTWDDVRDIAAIFYLLLTGKPWKKGQPSPASLADGIPRQVDAILMQALSDDPAVHPKSMAKLLDTLSGVADPITAIRMQYTGLGGGKRRMFSLISGIASGALLLAGVVLIALHFLYGVQPPIPAVSTPVPQAAGTFAPTASPTLAASTPQPTPNEATPAVCDHPESEIQYYPIDGNRVEHNKVCQKCGETTREAHVSNEDEWKSDATNHMHVCDKCKMRYDYEEHKYDKNGKCTECGYVKHVPNTPKLTPDSNSSPTLSPSAAPDSGLAPTPDVNPGPTPPPSAEPSPPPSIEPSLDPTTEPTLPLNVEPIP